MSDNALKDQIENFKKGRDIAVAEESSQLRLFVRGEVLHTVFTAKPWEDNQLVAGEELFAVDEHLQPHVALLRGNRKAGYVDGDGAQVLTGLLNRANAAAMLPIKIMEVDPLSGIAKAEVIWEDV